MFRMDYMGEEKKAGYDIQWHSYCRTERILHRNVNLLDRSMIMKKKRRFRRK